MISKNGHNFIEINPSLCTLCGTCIGICPYDALSVKNERVVLTSECKNCGLCFDICPGSNIDFIELNKKIFRVNECDNKIGFFHEICRGYSSDVNIRKNASSGGVVTALLLYLIDKKLIDGAIIVGTNLKEPLQPEVKIARNRDEIIQASQSKYCLVPVNAILRTLREENGKFAFVGLPCHIHGLRKLQLANWPHSSKILIMIGLYCGFNMHFSGTEFLLDKLGIKKNDVIDLKYRGRGHPGGFLVKTKQNEHFLGKHVYNLINLVFIPKRCLTCADLTNEFADISVGDIWKKTDGNGWSSIIIRSSSGQKILYDAKKFNYLIVEDLDYSDLISSHNHLLKYKKEYIYSRLDMGFPKPNLNIKRGYLRFSTRVIGFFSGYILLILGSGMVKTFLSCFPLQVIVFIGRAMNVIIRKSDNNEL